MIGGITVLLLAALGVFFIIFANGISKGNGFI